MPFGKAILSSNRAGDIERQRAARRLSTRKIRAGRLAGSVVRSDIVEKAFRNFLSRAGGLVLVFNTRPARAHFTGDTLRNLSG